MVLSGRRDWEAWRVQSPGPLLAHSHHPMLHVPCALLCAGSLTNGILLKAHTPEALALRPFILHKKN